jgi:holliday junction DNA helicase RuvA
MITFLQGVLAEKEPTRIVVDVGGVGYEVFIPLSSFDRLPAAGDPVKVLTYDHVREDVRALYGFVSEGEREVFLLLLGVSGIGPRTALSALSGMSVRDIRGSIAEGNVKRLSSIPGIGKKTAERIVVDLKDKLGAADILAAAAPEGPRQDPRARDAILALISLGYKQADAQQRVKAALAKAKAGATVEELIRLSLAG